MSYYVVVKYYCAFITTYTLTHPILYPPLCFAMCLCVIIVSVCCDCVCILCLCAFSVTVPVCCVLCVVVCRPMRRCRGSLRALRTRTRALLLNSPLPQRTNSQRYGTYTRTYCWFIFQNVLNSVNFDCKEIISACGFHFSFFSVSSVQFLVYFVLYFYWYFNLNFIITFLFQFFHIWNSLLSLS